MKLGTSRAKPRRNTKTVARSIRYTLSQNLLHLFSSETLSINVGQIIVGISFPLVAFEFGYFFETMVGIVFVVAR